MENSLKFSGRILYLWHYCIFRNLNKEEDDMTVHILNFDKNFQETQYQKIYIGERIRDIIDLNDGSVLMTLESSGSFGILKNIY